MKYSALPLSRSQMTSKATGNQPTEAVLSSRWDGHQLLYIEAILIEATHQGRRVLVVVDERARRVPDWQRVSDLLAGHDLVTVDFEHDNFEDALPSWIERVIILEGDRVLRSMPRILARRRHLHAAVLLMREPGVRGHASSSWRLTVLAAKTVLVSLLSALFGSRCEIHVLRSPLFPPSSTTRRLVAAGRCVTIFDPVLKSSRSELETRVGTGLSDAKPIALVVGRLDERKSLEELLQVWATPDLSPYRLELRGEVHYPNFEDFLQRALQGGADVLVENRHLTDDELLGATLEASAVLCLHKWSLPSGIAALALDAGCPVIGLSGTSLGDAVQTHKLGAAVRTISGKELAAAIDVCHRLPRSEIRARAASLHEVATTTHFGKQLLGEPPI